MTIFGRLWSCKLTGRRRYDSQLQLNSKLRKDPIGIDRNMEHSILFATSRTIDSGRDQTCCCLIDLKILDVVDDDVVTVVVEHWIDAEKTNKKFVKPKVKPFLRKTKYIMNVKGSILHFYFLLYLVFRNFSSLIRLLCKMIQFI